MGHVQSWSVRRYTERDFSKCAAVEVLLDIHEENRVRKMHFVYKNILNWFWPRIISIIIVPLYHNE